MSADIKAFKRIVVKVDTAVFVENHHIASLRIAQLCKLVADLKPRYEVILVTAGAIAVGHTEQPLSKSDVPNQLALASLGQLMLMRMYYTEFQKYDVRCSQLLLSVCDFDSHKHIKQTRNMIEVLLANNVVPIINQNDVTALEEFGLDDNDQMAADVAYHFGADLLVVLSDVDGYYTASPHPGEAAAVRLVVNRLTQEELEDEAMPTNPVATGGIVAKLQAAHFLLNHGMRMYLASGFRLEMAREFLLHGKHAAGTLFCPPSVPAA